MLVLFVRVINMPGIKSDSIDELLGKKREVDPKVSVEAGPAEPLPETSTPAPAAVSPEISPKTLAEQIKGREKEVSAEAAAPSGAGAVAAAKSMPTQSATGAGGATTDFSALKSLPSEEQVKILTEIVMTKGLEKALATIKRLQNPYLYDLLHDTLVDELYQRLKGPKLKE